MVRRMQWDIGKLIGMGTVNVHIKAMQNKRQWPNFNMWSMLRFYTEERKYGVQQMFPQSNAMKETPTRWCPSSLAKLVYNSNNYAL